MIFSDDALRGEETNTAISTYAQQNTQHARAGCSESYITLFVTINHEYLQYFIKKISIPFK